MQLIGQILSVAGMACIIASMQCKRMKYFYAAQFSGAVLYTVSYLLLGSPAGAILNVFAILRALILLGGDRFHKPLWLGLLTLALAGTSVMSFWTDGWLGIFPALAQLGGTLGMWTRNGAKVRIMQFFCVSPLWLTYNILVFSIGGILCESFCMVSVIVSVIRFGWRALLRQDAEEETK